MLGEKIGQLNDFSKGWALHLYADNLQSGLFKENFSEYYPANEPIAAFNTAWIVTTALKILLDIEVLQHIHMAEYSANLSHVETPNNEDPKRVDAFNSYVREFYDQDVEIASYFDLFEHFHVPQEVAVQVVEIAERLKLSTQSTMKKVYEEMLETMRTKLM